MHLGVLFPFVNLHITNICFSRLLIATITFECSNHCNDVDNISGSVKEDKVEKLNSMVNDDNIQGRLVESAITSLDFLKCWGLSVLTTCCY